MRAISTIHKRYPVTGRVLLVFAMLSALLGLSQQTAQAGRDSRKAEKPKVESNSLLKLWEEHSRLINAEKIDQSDSVVDAMVLERIRRGISNLQVYSTTLIKESLELANEDKNKNAYRVLAQARRLAPDFYGTYYLEARYMLGNGRILDAVVAWIAGIKRKYSTFATAFPALFNYMLVVLGAYYWALLLFALFLAIRYAKLAAHDLQERVPGFDKLGATVMAAVMIVFPAAFIPNVMFYAFVLILLLWIYSSMRERIVAAVLAALLFVIPLPFRFIGNGIAAKTESDFNAVIQLREGEWGEKEIKVLKQAVKSEERSSAWENSMLSLAQALAHTGKYEEALSTLDELKAAAKTAPLVNFLKGNIYFRWEKYTDALSEYKKAAKLLPADPAVHFNLAMVLSRPEIVDISADSVERAEQEIQLAKDLNPELVDTWTSYRSLDPGRFVVVMSIPMDRIWDNLRINTPDRTKAGDTLFRSFSGEISLDAIPYIALCFLVLMGILTFVEPFLGHARACSTCGEPFCSKCRPGDNYKTVCTRCLNIFEARTGLDPRTRERARAEVRMKHDRAVLAAEIMSIVLPGSGHLLLGKSVRGVMFSIISLTFLMGMAYRQGVLRSEWLMPDYSNLVAVLLIAFLYIVFVGFSVWNVSLEK